MKIVINKCYGGFGLSHEGKMHYAKLKGLTLHVYVDDRRTKLGYKPAPKDVSSIASYSLMYSTVVVKTKKDLDDGYWDYGDIPRDDPHLVQTVEDLGDKANGSHAKLRVVEVPDDVKWEVEEYDGMEWVAEVHQTWG